jgi:hypothetical protein
MLGEERHDRERGFALRDPNSSWDTCDVGSEEGEPMTTPEWNGPAVIDATTLAERLGRHEPVTVLDVRRPERWSEDRDCIPGAAWVPHAQVPRRAQDFPSDRDLVVYCS